MSFIANLSHVLKKKHKAISKIKIDVSRLNAASMRALIVVAGLREP
jgi:hypothetical protein